MSAFWCSFRIYSARIASTPTSSSRNGQCRVPMDLKPAKVSKNFLRNLQGFTQVTCSIDINMWWRAHKPQSSTYNSSWNYSRAIMRRSGNVPSGCSTAILGYSMVSPIRVIRSLSAHFQDQETHSCVGILSC